ncbi:hypothetical protein DIPPA_15853 [Diplonema papillatum]|nr:hypothetical protein DIPPA_15853 [Diplonema papillatum]
MAGATIPSRADGTRAGAGRRSSKPPHPGPPPPAGGGGGGGGRLSDAGTLTPRGGGEPARRRDDGCLPTLAEELLAPHPDAHIADADLPGRRMSPSATAGRVPTQPQDILQEAEAILGSAGTDRAIQSIEHWKQAVHLGDDQKLRKLADDKHARRDTMDDWGAARELTAAPRVGSNANVHNPKLVPAVQDLPGYGQEDFVSQLLSAVVASGQHSPEVCKEAGQWLNAHKSNASERSLHALSVKVRFADGVDHAKSLEGLRKVEYWPPDYNPGFDVMTMVRGLADWHTPRGICWPRAVVQDLHNNCLVMVARHAKNKSQNLALPIYIYTSTMYRKILWAVWCADQEKWSECRHWRDLEENRTARSNGLVVRLTEAAFKEVSASLPLTASAIEKGLRLIKPEKYGLEGFVGGYRTATGEHAHYYLIRYECDGVTSLLANSVAWVSDPVTYFEHPTFAIDQCMPPPGVFEYLESRPPSSVTTEKDWSVWPIGFPGCADLIKACYAEKNQSRYARHLHEQLVHILDDDVPLKGNTRPLRSAMEAKLPRNNLCQPTPLDIAHALEMQKLVWKDKEFIIGLSGFPRVMVDSASPDDVIPVLYRVYHDCIEQPFALLNATMRNMQLDPARGSEVALDVLPRHREASGNYFLDAPRDPPDKPQTLPFAADDGRRAVWNEREYWVVSAKGTEYKVEPEGASMRLGVWMMPAVRPFMWFLEEAIRSIQSEEQVVKSYRGLADVTLAREQYTPGGLVLWGAYSSSSADQATATWFAMQAGSAAVFTLRGKTCKMIAPWSRFAREQEYLYAPNTCFQVKTMLTEDQQQILQREELQLCELDEVDDLEAITIYITQTINNVVRGQGRLVNQLVGIVQALVNRELVTALERSVTPGEPLMEQNNGMEIVRRVRELAIGMANVYSDEVHNVLNYSLNIAAKEGYIHTVEKLIDLGADPSASFDHWHPIEHALIGGHMATVELLLKKGGLGSPRDYAQRPIDGNNQTLLHKMAQLGMQKGILLLLKMGADPTVCDKRNQTPASLAFSHKHKELVHLLSPTKALPEQALQQMYAYWASSHYNSGELRARFMESRTVVECTPYGFETYQLDTSAKHRDVFGIVEGLKAWRSPKGLVWGEDAVEAVLQETRMMVSRHPGGKTSETVVPIFVYTASMYHTTLWAVWLFQPEHVVSMKGGWKMIETMTDSFETAYSEYVREVAPTLKLDSTAREEVAKALTTTTEDVPTSLVPLKTGNGVVGFSSSNVADAITSAAASSPHTAGLRAGAKTDVWETSLGPDGMLPVCIFRFRANDVSSTKRVSNSSCVSWLPDPQVAFGKHPLAIDRSLPLFSILEYIYSRSSKETLKSCDGKSWDCEPANLPDLRKFADSQPSNAAVPLVDVGNRREKLKEYVNERYKGSKGQLLRAALEKVLPNPGGDGPAGIMPTLEMIAPGLELQFLTVEDQEYVVGLSGSPKVIAFLSQGERGAERKVVVSNLYRVCWPWAPMPYALVSETVTNTQRSDSEPRLSVLDNANAFGGKYEIVPTDADPGGVGATMSTRKRKPFSTVRQQPSMSNLAQTLTDTQHTDSYSIGEVGSHRGSTPPRSSAFSTHTSLQPVSHEFSEGEEFRRTEAPYHVIKWDEMKLQWALFPAATNIRTVLLPGDVSLHLGTYMQHYVAPLLAALTRALAGLRKEKEPSSRSTVLYRVGHANKESPSIYDNAVVWHTVVPASESALLVRSIFSEQEHPLLFHIRSSSARRVSQWSRFGREREWAIPPTVVFETKKVESDSWLPVRYLEEVDQVQALVLFARDLISLLMTARSPGGFVGTSNNPRRAVPFNAHADDNVSRGIVSGVLLEVIQALEEGPHTKAVSILLKPMNMSVCTPLFHSCVSGLHAPSKAIENKTKERFTTLRGATGCLAAAAKQ